MDNLKNVGKVILVLSGKGGVGKSSVATQIAMSLYLNNYSVGLLDIDLCGPSIPRMLRLQHQKVHQTAAGWLPVYFEGDQRFSVMSIGFLLPNPDDSVVWRGPKKNSMIKQFCQSVAWGHLDYLIIDTPPGTSDEHMAIIEYLQESALSASSQPKAIMVTTPQLIAVQDVEKEISFCRNLNVPILGIIENMSGYVCPHCSGCSNIFSSGGGDWLAKEYSLKFLGKLPICPKVARILEGGDQEQEQIEGNEEIPTGQASTNPSLIEAFKETELYPIFNLIIKDLN